MLIDTAMGRNGTLSRRLGDRPGFTLIELLVVIAIIALLISILLPGIKRARLSGWQTKSLANIRSICTGAFAYQNDYNGYMPVAPLRPTGRGQVLEGRGTEGDLNNICSWTFGGKDPNQYWGGGPYDHEAIDRPLNTYLSSEALPWEGQTGDMPPTHPTRRLEYLQVFRDPSDRYSLQQRWSDSFPNLVTDQQIAQYTSRDPVTREPLSSYNDVGTSYHANLKWHMQLYQSGVPWKRSFFAGLRRLRQADTFLPSQLCWITDQYADIVVYNTSPTFLCRNGYGDINRAIMGFMDGHASYLTVLPGRAPAGTAWDRWEPYNNVNYTFIFPYLR